jgi:NTE family protein
VSVGAVNVHSGNLQFFDNGEPPPPGSGPRNRQRNGQRLRAEHFMASGALPPAFAAVEIDGEHYWDGGIVSNTPLDHVLGASPRRNLHAFQVDLWSARGPLPRNVFEAQERLKDIQYSSRTRRSTDSQADSKHLRRLLHELLTLLPDSAQRNAWVARAEALACDRHFSVTHLIYRDKSWEGSSKDYEFSPRTMREHWASGLADIRATLAHPDWLRTDAQGREFVTHDRGRLTPPPSQP